jgi:hypothetical protein
MGKIVNGYSAIHAIWKGILDLENTRFQGTSLKVVPFTRISERKELHEAILVELTKS